MGLSFHINLLSTAAVRRARYDKFGEEGLKGGVPTTDGGIGILC